MIKLTINGKEIEAKEGTTILDAAKSAGIHIPTLCHLNLHNTKMVNQSSNCRICVVEQEGRRNLAPACTTVASDGMVIHTNTPRAVKARRNVLELILSNHPKDCLTCSRNQSCELQNLANELSVRDIHFKGKRNKYQKDTSSLSIVRDQEKCVLCRRCETMCNKVQTVGVYSPVLRGFSTTMSTAFDEPIMDTICTFCGQCVSVCPTGALTQVDNTSKVWDAINDNDKTVIVQTAPAVRAALGEEFGFPVGTNVTGKMVAALRGIGFDKVCDTNFAADLTILEEAHEFIDRLQNGGKLPILTSCCPAWVKFIEHQFPELLDIPSTCKSPQEMFGAIAKTYMAEKLGLKRENVVVVSVMPCLAKKYESQRSELGDGKTQDVDYVITTRELAKMIREAGIQFEALPDEEYDDLLGYSTGAADIFGTSGGVLEAAVRTAKSWLEGKNIDKLDFTAVRGMEGIREAELDVAGIKVKAAIAHGLGNARTLFEKIIDGTADYHIIEVMACPSGCVGGGGQPYYLEHNTETLKKRAKVLYKEDATKLVRLSHENPQVQALYKDFLGEVGGHKAHELLHTEYTKRSVY